MLGLIILFFLLLAWVYLDARRWKALVRRFLEEKGCSQVKIRTRVFTGRRHSVAYTVEYRTSSGILQTNACVVGTNRYSPESITWEKPFFDQVV